MWKLLGQLQTKHACDCKSWNQIFLQVFCLKAKSVYCPPRGSSSSEESSHLLPWPRPTATGSLSRSHGAVSLSWGRKWLVTSLPTPWRERNCQEQLLERFQTPSDSPQAAESEAHRGLFGINHKCWVIIWRLLPCHLLISRLQRSRTFQFSAEAGCWHILKLRLILNICFFFFFFTLFIQLLGFQFFLALPSKFPRGKVLQFMRKVEPLNDCAAAVWCPAVVFKIT